ncbi:hypothetical protein [Halobellus ordinarius]|uniref:hypothetical protein n=1 Tax=Halobellus ordinarius TaxID=3075120 RepID=UPI00288070D5|nr:hypothetical protein [Halobellus sp. ZY16]
MADLPIKELWNAIGGVAIMAFVAVVGLTWAFRNISGGTFSDLLPKISTIGFLSLIIVGGGVLAAVSWLLGYRPGDGF